MNLLLEPNVQFNKQIESLKIYTATSYDFGKKIKYSQESIDTTTYAISYQDENKMAAVVIQNLPNGHILMVSILLF